jgi:hypothetical protein
MKRVRKFFKIARWLYLKIGPVIAIGSNLMLFVTIALVKNGTIHLSSANLLVLENTWGLYGTFMWYGWQVILGVMITDIIIRKTLAFIRSYQFEIAPWIEYTQ